MIIDHLMYNLATTFSFLSYSNFGRVLTTFANTYVYSSLRAVGWPIAVGVFTLLCGISTGLSRNNLLRGLRLLFLSYTITFVLSLSDVVLDTRMAINFGVLHTLAFCVLIYTLTTNNCKRIKIYDKKSITITLQDVMLSILTIFAFYITLCNGVPVRSDSLNPVYSSLGEVGIYEYYTFALGVNRNLLLSTDYIPLLPWLGVFSFGCIISTRFYPDKKSLFESRSALNKSFISKLGRKSLLVYIVHQPIIYLLLGLLSLIVTGRFI